MKSTKLLSSVVLFGIGILGRKPIRKRIVIFLLATVIPASVHLAEAQAPAKVHRIGFLAFGSPPSGPSPSLEAFRQRLRKLGYVEGENLVLELRYAKGKIGRLPSQAAELVRLKTDIIVTSGTLFAELQSIVVLRLAPGTLHTVASTSRAAE